MNRKSRADGDPIRIKRRDFVKSGSAALVGGAVLGRAAIPESKALPEFSRAPSLFPVQPNQQGRIKSYRTLGRTGFKVSDVSLGASFLRDVNVVRYAFDKGMNYIDTADSYQGGAAERAIRGALGGPSAYRPGTDLHIH
jgi:hypothetical protein